jgi:hypothetical protein
MCPRSAWARSPAPPRTVARSSPGSSVRFGRRRVLDSELGWSAEPGRQTACTTCTLRFGPPGGMGTLTYGVGSIPAARVSGPSPGAACQQTAGCCWRAQPDDSFGRAVAGGAGWRVDRTGRWWRTHLRRGPCHSLARIVAETRNAGRKDAGSAIGMHVISRMRAGAPASHGARTTTSSAPGGSREDRDRTAAAVLGS